MKNHINYKKRQDFYRVLLSFLLVFDLFCLGFSFYLSKQDTASDEVYLSKQKLSSDEAYFSSGKVTDEKMVIPCGLPVGVYVKTEGLLVLDTQILKCADGLNYEPAKNVVKEGDYIKSANGEEVESKEELQDLVENSNGQKMELEIVRDKKETKVVITPVMTNEGTYKLGIWLRDDTQGLGTITYIDGNRFGALGHGINDYDTGEQMEIEEGSIYQARILSVKKGESGSPGELVGQIEYEPEEYIGKIESNSEEGIYGIIECDVRKLTSQREMPVADKKDVKKGKAYIRFVFDGKSKDYEIKIIKTDDPKRNKRQGILFEIVDEELLRITGGVVQGMSGSPIIQDGRLVGAVTHVLVNDPTKGYGIYIENMLKH